MSKPRYDWWSYAKSIAKRWGALRDEYDDSHSQSITPSLSGVPSGGSVSRPVENAALRTLPGVKQKEYDAARFALEEIMRRPEAGKRKEIVKLVYWNKVMTIAGAAIQVGYSERTARRICWCYVLAIGRGMGFIAEDEYLEAMKRDNN